MRLHLVKAKEGDGLILESGGADRRVMLIDGGPGGCWQDFMRPYLEAVLGPGREIDILAISHVDNDHVIAPLDLLAERERRRVGGDAGWPAIGEIWHNSFEATIDGPGLNIAAQIKAMVAGAAYANFDAAGANWVLAGIGEGARLRRSALRERIALNRSFDGGLLSPDELDDPVARLGTTAIRLVGPTRANLVALRDKWLEWARAAARARNATDLANLDKSIPNLSSLVFVAEEAGRRILFTGDARGDHIEQGLHQAGLMDGGSLHVDILKLQHHGSKRNVEPGFFDRITADIYAVSANGRHGNPDYETLVWIVEAAKARRQAIEIYATYSTPSIERLLETHAPGSNGFDYCLHLPAEGERALLIDLG
jgi:hypothetical protein